MLKCPPPPVELPPEITVTEHGDGDVTFVFPARQLGWARHLGWLSLAAAALLLYWVVQIGRGNLPAVGQPLEVGDYFITGVGLLLACFAYFPIGLGLAILAGHREVTLRGGKLRTTERVGFLWRTKRWPLPQLDTLEIIGIF